MSAKVRQLNTPELAAELWRVAECGDVEELLRLLPRVNDINARNRHGMTALMKAAFFGHEPVVRALLEHRAEGHAEGGQREGGRGDAEHQPDDPEGEPEPVRHIAGQERDEHVEADSVHEAIAANDLAGEKPAPAVQLEAPRLRPPPGNPAPNCISR